MATPHLKEGKVSVIALDDWSILKTIDTEGPGFFMRSHENSAYAWTDVFFGPNKDVMHVIDKRSLEIVKTLKPAPGKTAAHVEFDRHGRHAIVSIWEKDGAIVIYDAATLEEVKRIPMSKPSGKYNVWNKITFSEGTATEAGVKPALLIVAHGERGGLRRDGLSHSLVDRMLETHVYRDVQACFISKEPTLKTVLADLSPGPVLIYPLFMSDGYFVMQAIPQMLEAEIRHASNGSRGTGRPQSGLPKLVAQHGEAAAQAVGFFARDVQLLLVAHGSKSDPASRNAAQCVASALAMEGRFAGIELAFLEESPFLDDQIGAVAGPVVVVGLFAGEGLHGGVDLPEAVDRAGRKDVILSSPLARSPALMRLIADDLDRMTAP